ncbi:MAG: hypothetical protein K2X38_03355 [Gemmataceae bacterium]|nr:hypothetical protein [Gemmataceae bacterium]
MGWLLGLDLGQVADRSALAIVEQPDLKKPRSYCVRHLERFELGTPYPTVVARLKKILQRPELAHSVLAVDMTGVGRPVVELLKQASLDVRLWPITITSGKAPSCDGYSYSVPKRDLVAVLQVLLQTRRLKIAKGLPAAAELIRELSDFRSRFTESANEVFGPEKSSQHDDLVLALALAAWAGEHQREPFELPFDVPKPPPPPPPKTRLQEILEEMEAEDDRGDRWANPWRRW